MRRKKGEDMKQKLKSGAQGAVSLFVVIFTAILLTGVTVGFTILMLSDQERSTDNDLAQSARDSAEAGVEDAKRVLAQLADCQNRGVIDSSGSSSDPVCNRISQAVTAGECNTISVAMNEGDTAERKISQTEGDNQLDQAYTCVTISPDTDAFVGQIRNEGDMQVVPLRSYHAFDTVEISWIDRTDISGDIDFSSGDVSTLPNRSDWEDQGAGDILRVGKVIYGTENISPQEMDEQARTVFLRAGGPTAPNPTIDLTGFAVDGHTPISPGNLPEAGGSHNEPHLVRCENATSETTEGYLCKTTIRVKDIADSRLVDLTLASVYRQTSFSIVLKDSTSPERNIQFRGVQPEVDSTGRANDVFRRVVSRVEARGDSAPFPRAAVATDGSICKNFTVTDDPADYNEGADSRTASSGCYNLSTGSRWND